MKREPLKVASHSTFHHSYPKSVDGLVPGVFHLMVVCFLALQNVDLLERQQREELNPPGHDEGHVRLNVAGTHLIFGLQQSLQLLQGLGQLVLQQVTGALARMSLQVSNLVAQKH